MRKIVIVGAGVIGCGVARELSRYRADIVVLERENDISCGTSKANSGIVHAGFDAHTGSNKAKFNVAGNAMFDALAKELDFPFRRNGAFVLCFDDSQTDRLRALYDQGIGNGVTELRILDGDEARRMSPNLSDRVVAALYAPTSGIVSPYEMTVAYAENAARNGVRFRRKCEITAIRAREGGWNVTAGGEEFFADVVINCAGVYADTVHRMASDEPLQVVARKGEYVLLDKECGGLTDQTLFQLPTHMGKGILIAPTTHGNILVGPTATDVEDKRDVDTTPEGLRTVIDKARLSVPQLPTRSIITQFSGLRAHCDRNDFVIGWAREGFYDVAGIESPGLTASPAIATHVAQDVARKLDLQTDDAFVAERRAIPCFARLDDRARAELIASDPAYGQIVCRCETVTEGEIVESIRRPVGAVDLDGVKRRTRAGMGRCQSGFCTARILQILARELGTDVADVTKKGGDSRIVFGRLDK